MSLLNVVDGNQHVEIRRFERHAELWIDGVKVPGAVSVNLAFGVDRVLVVSISFHASDFKVIDHRDSTP